MNPISRHATCTSRWQDDGRKVIQSYDGAVLGYITKATPSWWKIEGDESGRLYRKVSDAAEACAAHGRKAGAA